VVGAQRARRGDKAPRESESWGVLSTGLPSPQRCDGNGRVAGSPKERMVFRELKKKKKKPKQKTERDVNGPLQKAKNIQNSQSLLVFFFYFFSSHKGMCHTN